MEPQRSVDSSPQDTSGLAPTRRNSLNLIRLVLAGLVIWPHTLAVAGLEEPLFAGRSTGTWAVAGFFAVSGYLIIGSRNKLPFWVFLRHRCARIYPAYWACLAVTAVAGLVFRGMTGEWREAVSYVVRNATLVQVQPSVGDVTVGSGFPIFNASLWTLPYEMVCYLVAAGLAGPVVRRFNPLLTGRCFVAAVAVHVVLPHVVDNPGVAVRHFPGLLALFLGGALLRLVNWPWLLRPALIPAHAGLVVVATLLAPRVGPEIVSVSVAATLIALSRVLPSPAWFQRNDLSYGAYIYGFPVAQILFLATPLGRSLPALMAGVYVTTAVCAATSWFALEKRALAWAHAVDGRRRLPALGRAG